MSTVTHKRGGLWGWIRRTILRIDGRRAGLVQEQLGRRVDRARGTGEQPAAAGRLYREKARADAEQKGAGASITSTQAADASDADSGYMSDRATALVEGADAQTIDPEQWFADQTSRRSGWRGEHGATNGEPVRGVRRAKGTPAFDRTPMGELPGAAEADASAGDDDALQPAGAVLRSPREHEAGSVLPSVRQGLLEIPPLPHVVRELLKELSDPGSTSRSVARIATTDPMLAAALIRTVNSAAMGLRRKINSVTEAVSYLGYSVVRSLVIRMRLELILPARAGQPGYDAEDLWFHSLAVSYAADCLAERIPRVDRGFVSTLGLLHDIGKLAINSQFPESAATLKKLVAQPGENFLDRERRVLGADHAEIGAILADHWKLTGDLIEAIRWHHAPLNAPSTLSPEVRTATAIVHLANQLAKYCYVYSEDMEIDIVGDEVFRDLGVPGPLTRLLNSRMRLAISRAIFVADESAARPLRAVRRFVRLSDRPIVQRILKSPPKPTRAVGRIMLAEEAEELFPAQRPGLEWTSLRPALGNEAALRSKGLVRFTGQTSPLSIEAMVLAVTRHQESLGLDDDVRMPARFLIRRLLPNLLEASDGHVSLEIAQWTQDDRLAVVVRTPVLEFTRRFGKQVPTQSALGVVGQDMANVLNLRWFAEIRTSLDGSVLRFVTHGNRR